MFDRGHQATAREEIKLRILESRIYKSRISRFLRGLLIFVTFPMWLPIFVLGACLGIILHGDSTGWIDYGAPVVRVEPWNQS